MLLVIFTCIPGIAALVYFFGQGYLINSVWLILLALTMESLVLKIRRKAILPCLKDYSAIVTALLLAVSIPPTAPWWIGLTGIFFAIVIAKHLFGGLGYNPFNPAMVGYAVLLISFPVEMTRWLLPSGIAQEPMSLSLSFQQIFGSADINQLDAYTGATALDAFKQERAGQLVQEFWRQNSLMGAFSGKGWEWVNLAFLLGGLYLLYRKIISWHIPVSIIVSITLLATVFYDGGSSASHGSPLYHLFGGATMLGAFFIATDPVSAATTDRGKLVYGALIGILIFVIRIWGEYPDGVAFAVLLGNFTAPALDAFTQTSVDKAMRAPLE